jgi:hypothetical protein
MAQRCPLAASGELPVSSGGREISITGSLYSLSCGSPVAHRKGSLMACAGRAARQKGRCAAPARAPSRGQSVALAHPVGSGFTVHSIHPIPRHLPARALKAGREEPRPQARFSSRPSSTRQALSQAHQHPCRLRRPPGGLSAPGRPPLPPGLDRRRASASPIVQVCGGHCRAVSMLKPPSTRRQS